MMTSPRRRPSTDRLRVLSVCLAFASVVEGACAAEDETEAEARRRGRVTLSTHTDGDGAGTVERTPHANRYRVGTSVTLTAVPASGSYFVAWHGDLDPSLDVPTTPVLDVVMDRSRQVWATFSSGALPLDVEISGAGTVERTPDLPAYPVGSRVTLRAVPGAMHEFVRWNGFSEPVEIPQIEVEVQPGLQVGVEFTGVPISFDLTIDGPGEVDLSPPPDPSIGQYRFGTHVQLLAVPWDDAEFAGWTGALGGDQPFVGLVLDRSSTEVTARFVPAARYQLTVAIEGDGAVTREPDEPLYRRGQVVTLRPSPGAGSFFDGWFQRGGDAPEELVVVMDGDVSVPAYFTRVECEIGTSCEGACVDEQRDRANCGACGNACGDEESCIWGVCVRDCRDQTMCGDVCVDTNSDPNNCGACGVTCGFGESCVGYCLGES